jgi:hypothetical protein
MSKERRPWAGAFIALAMTLMMLAMILPQPVAAEVTLEAPTLYEPSYGRSGDLILVWEKVANATSYTAQVAMNSEFNSPKSMTTTAGQVMFTGLLPGWYYCRVRATNGAVVSNWSEAQLTWVSAGDHLAAVTISSMVGSNGNATIQWNAVPNAGRYMVEICADPGFDPPLYHSDTPGTSWTFSNLSSGIYQVRVCAYNESAWSGWTTATILIGGGPVNSSVLPLILIVAVAVILIGVFLWWRWKKR